MTQHIIPVTDEAYRVLDSLGVGREGILGQLVASSFDGEEEKLGTMAVNITLMGSRLENPKMRDALALLLRGGYRLFGIPDEPLVVNFVMRACRCSSGVALRIIREGVPVANCGFVILDDLPEHVQKAYVEEVTVKANQEGDLWWTIANSVFWYDVLEIYRRDIDAKMKEKFPYVYESKWKRDVGIGCFYMFLSTVIVLFILMK